VHAALGLVAIVITVLVFAGLARRFELSAPLLLTVVGVIASYLPFVPEVVLEPELVLVGLLPPLLYAAAIRTSLVDFRRNVRPIMLLSVGLVIFNTICIGLLVWWLLPVPLAAALAKHFETTALDQRPGHPVMRSVEPGEAWRWCYVDARTG
jgi:CPA1 family monovalent cation:H+ antiporter